MSKKLEQAEKKALAILLEVKPYAVRMRNASEQLKRLYESLSDADQESERGIYISGLASNLEHAADELDEAEKDWKALASVDA